MKHFKIIETAGEYPDVLLYRDRDELGTEKVNILAIGESEGEEDYYACEFVVFKDMDGAIDFIRDFSLESANSFCQRNDISYI